MRQRFVLDCSVAVAWILPNQSVQGARGLLESIEQFQPVVPSIWELEITNVLLVQGTRSAGWPRGGGSTK